VGKLAGTALPARLLRIEWRRSVQLGVMMSCRGLTELVILDIGLRLGLVSPRLFAMLVVMTLVTTTITTPLLRRLGVGQSGEEPGPSDTAPPPGSRIHRAGRL
jgi:Kef-type K+ transport system membrane component KefB